mmetsp:Transcript_61317/g.179205  ORF Transcript_61317/g.179205 Transcript_61317/m.179205 type:complete len:242 (-) Transcript_61317:326-1051(-)
MMKTRTMRRPLLMSSVFTRIRGRAPTLPKYRSKSVKQKRFLPPAMASKTASTRSKCASSDITPLLSMPGRMKSSTAWFCCTAAMSSSFDTEPLLSASMSSKMSRISSFLLLFAFFATSSLPLKCAAKSASVILILPFAIVSKRASAASKLRSLLIRAPQSTPGKTMAASSLSRAREVMTFSFEIMPLPSGSSALKASLSSGLTSSSSATSSSCTTPLPRFSWTCMLRHSPQRSKSQPWGQR